ncbi:MAG: phytanoyl-CoA dioxygenase family protein [Candidatus Latescibacteria bacterium]|nr:phytanoyl-CoA dioxygenase family protein [Candidatus Latescibacterota bacterium]
MLTPEQAAFFQTFGFVTLRQAFSPDEMAEVSREFDELVTQDRQGLPFPGEKRQSLYGIAEKSPLITRLVDDDRFYTTVEHLLGPGFLWLCSEGNLYVGDTPWHPDGTRLNAIPLKVSLYLDPLTKETGCLRVLPGSHRLPLHEDIKALTKLGMAGADLPGVPFESQPGDVLFANMNLWHAAFGGRSGRRHLAISFFSEPTTDEHLTLLRENYDGLLVFIQRLQYSQPGRVFTDEFLYSDRPRIRRMAAKWVELGLR